MRLLRSTTLRGAAVAAAFGLVLGGCAADPEPDGEGVDEVVEGADEVVVADEDEDQSVTVDDLDDTAIVEGDDEAEAALQEAVAASRTGTARTSFSSVLALTGLDDGVDGEGVVSGDGDLAATALIRGRLAESFDVYDAPVEVRIVDDVTYLRFPQLMATTDVDAEWLSTTDDPVELDVGGIIERVRMVDPATAFDVLDDVTAAAVVGEESLGGEPVTHYVASVELGAVALTAGATADVLTEASLDPERIVGIHAWVGDDGLVRRVQAEIDDDGAELLLEVEVLERDVDVVVEAPPAGDTMSVEEFVARRT